MISNDDSRGKWLLNASVYAIGTSSVVLAATGIDLAGKKQALDLREGATESPRAGAVLGQPD
jgi:hypothetical protein